MEWENVISHSTQFIKTRVANANRKFLVFALYMNCFLNNFECYNL